jgi:hypothetical protein
MTQNIYTENLAEFGAREREIAGRTLLAALPDNFDASGVKLAFNKNSGNVFLVNDDYQVAMLVDDDKLAIFHSTPYHGHEGFIDELLDLRPDCLNQDDVDYILDNAKAERAELPEAWQALNNDAA